jgi:ATP-dependent Clp protease protease subunit
MYCINPDDDEPIFLVDAQIGKDNSNPSEPYIDGQMFVRELLAMDGQGKKCIWIWINSPGGLVTDGMAMYGATLKTKTKVNTLCYGIAYSIAGVLFQSGRERVMLDYAKLMYHMAYNPDGTADKGLDVINDAIATMVSSRSWKDDKAVKRMMEQTSYINANDALAADLCDTIESSGKLNKPRTIAKWDKVIEYVNKEKETQQQNQQPTMKAIAKKLGLSETATEAEILEAINKQEEVNKKATTDRAEMEKELKNLKAKFEETEESEDKTKMKNAIENLEKKLNSYDTEKKNADDAAKKTAAIEKAKTKILETANKKELKLDDKAIERYVTLAGDSDDALNAVIETIEAIPTVKKAASLDITSGKNDGKVPVFKVDGKGGVTDTSDMMAYMNKTRLNASTKRFSGKE